MRRNWQPSLSRETSKSASECDCNTGNALLLKRKFRKHALLPPITGAEPGSPALRWEGEPENQEAKEGLRYL
jgi:hypothetical protein